MAHALPCDDAGANQLGGARPRGLQLLQEMNHAPEGTNAQALCTTTIGISTSRHHVGAGTVSVTRGGVPIAARTRRQLARFGQ